MDLSTLNPMQRQAVECLEGPLLVLAGAGSGKTRVLTYRIANLVEHGVDPANILALTFTNKAAREMRERAMSLVNENGDRLMVTTFHSFCARILRIDADKLGYDKNFTIYNDSDQMKVITDILKDMGMTGRSMPNRDMKERISNAKNKSTEPLEYLEDNYMEGDSGLTVRVFKQYQKRLMAANAMDFDDLLLKTIELFENFPEILDKYRRRYRYVLVDEYQDTNMCQYRITELIARAHSNLCVVGDDDQSIYGWRGADINNILSFEKDFKDTKVIRLEQNYRSTKHILDAANAVIDHNRRRKRKKLWTEQRGGDLITRYEAQNERDEAAFICRKILDGIRDGGSYNDFAILYRMNAQSRVLEGTLMNFGIPHRIYGGFRFYERREVVDIMSYLKLIANPNDDVAFERIVNVPKRGIGDKAIEELKTAASEQGISLFYAAVSGERLQNKTAAKFQGFVDIMMEAIAESTIMPLHLFTEQLVEKIEYEAYLAADDKKGEAQSRMENIRELVGNIKEIEADIPEGENPLTAFLENVTLISDIDSMEEGNGTVSLMTLHSAKGLEFDTVFLAGMEDNVFPSYRARTDLTHGAMEEERRLCYVGITRARKKLYLINAVNRALFGESTMNRASCFLSEIPENLIEQEGIVTRPKEIKRPSEFDDFYSSTPNFTATQGFGIRKTAAPAVKPVKKASATAFAPNMKVKHAKFGEGTILDVSGSGAAMTVTVDFINGGVKRFAAAYAPITVED